MNNTIHLLLILLYNGATYRHALSINPDDYPNPHPEHSIADVWREPECLDYLNGFLPSWLRDDHTIVGVENLDGVIL